MRRLTGILIALMLPMILVGGLVWATYQPGLPEMAQSTLARYQARLKQLGQPATMLEARPAAYPRAFTAALSGPTFGDGVYYGVSYVDVDTPGPWQPTATEFSVYTHTTTSGISAASYAGGQRPLPYPPDEAWCVRLQPERSGAPVTVLLALHQDLYNASWAVHELPAANLDQTLALLGCASK
jgi:hypothetical protein